MEEVCIKDYFDLIVTPAIFQQILDTILDGPDLSVGYFDDIMLRSKKVDEHKSCVARVFERIRDLGFKLVEDKYKLFMSPFK